MDSSSRGHAAGDGRETETGGAGYTGLGGGQPGAIQEAGAGGAPSGAEDEEWMWHSLSEVLQELLTRLEADVAVAPLVLTPLGRRTVPVLERRKPQAGGRGHIDGRRSAVRVAS